MYRKKKLGRRSCLLEKEPNGAEVWAGRCRGTWMPRCTAWAGLALYLPHLVGPFLPDNHYLTNHRQGEFLFNTFKRLFWGFVFKTDLVSSGTSRGIPCWVLREYLV